MERTDSITRKARCALAVAAAPAVLLSAAACTQLPPPPPAEPLAYSDPVVPVAPPRTTERIRDHAAAQYTAVRGGAAVRSPEDAYVLWNRHLGEHAVPVRMFPADQKMMEQTDKTPASGKRLGKGANKGKEPQKDASIYDRSLYGAKPTGTTAQQTQH